VGLLKDLQGVVPTGPPAEEADLPQEADEEGSGSGGDDRSHEAAEDCRSEEDEEEEEDAGPATTLVHGVPPGLKQALVPRRKKNRTNRVSVCVAKCRSSLRVVECALARFSWEQVSRDTSDVSVAWLEHTDSTASLSPFQ
ncbi:unnamed protein product, partial [Polarella glacialis]